MPRPRQNLIGQKFGKLTVMARSPLTNARKTAHWECLCDCGRFVTYVQGAKLQKGIKVCCLKCSRPVNPNALPARRGKPVGENALTPVGLPDNSKRVDLTGQSFGRWKVLGASPHTGYFWVAKCSCGTVKAIPAGHLTSGKSKSCGCARTELLKVSRSLPPVSEPHLINHQSNTLYRIWQSIKTRCYNKNHPTYASYGARGIKMAVEWKANFRAFASYVGPRPGEGYSIDRIDNDKGYVPGNVRWANRREQMENTRTNPIVKYQGQEIRLRSLADELGIPRGIMNHYAITLMKPLNEAIRLCQKALRVLDGSATSEEVESLVGEGPPPTVPTGKSRTSFIDLTGRQMGPWKVVAYLGKQGPTYPTEWLCQHDNGSRKALSYVYLKDFPWLNQSVEKDNEPQSTWV